jgi:PPM family protein phosphatase
MSRLKPALRPPRSVGVTDTGRVRENNQDAIFCDDALGLWLVADGMGGHAGGARASEIARDTISNRLDNGHDLRGAILDAHRAIRAEQEACPDYGDMGTTVVVVFDRGEEYEIGWVGDSRAYRYSSDTGKLELLTRDHNVAGMLVAAGALSPSEAARHPQRHVLTDCLGLVGENDPRVGSFQERWKSGDMLLICSDGLTGELEDDDIERILVDSPELEEASHALLEKALDAGAHDNVSLVLVSGPSLNDQVDKRSSRWPWPFRRRSL